MYKILNKLFGWDYVYWKIAWPCYNGISRIHMDGEGQPYYEDYGTMERPYGNPKVKIIWLTCKPEKYINKEGR